MDRLALIRGYVDRLEPNLDATEARHVLMHIHGVADCCALLARKRSLDPEISTIAGLIHDLYYYRTGVADFHQQSGAEMMRPALRDLGAFSEDETRILLSAVYHHGDKAHLHDEYDELLKDADTLEPFLSGAPAPQHGPRAARLQNLARELCLGQLTRPSAVSQSSSPVEPFSRREGFSRIAEELASRPIRGERDDEVYMNLIRYWPESAAFDELRNGWCAAFVYHACQEVGWKMPIRYPRMPCRFAGVTAWRAWADLPNVGLFVADRPDFLPERGDIVVYRFIIPPENKPESQREVPTDHIGVVVSVDERGFTAAEGNVNNKNESGLVRRLHHDRIEGFIRIPEDFQCDCRSIDFKTGEMRCISLGQSLA